VPSDEVALAVSTALDANKLFIVSAHEGIRLASGQEYIETRDDGSIVRLSPQETETLIASISALDEKAPQAALRELKLALRASKAGVDRVHIIDGREDGSVLKELFSNLGVGTMIYTDEYESIRALRSRDLPDILRLMEPLMQAGILIRRTVEQIQEKKDDYVVFEIDGSVCACGALHNWSDSQGEIAAVAADPFYAGMKLGRRIVGYLTEKARNENMSRVFVLTTQTQDWFESLGFTEVSVECLPERKRKLYDQSRKSKVFVLDL
jgi:amino-acid N-acetyltransferase